MRPLLLTAIVVRLAACLVADAHEITLKPGMPALTNVGVPLLWQDVPNADKAHAEARITPEKPYRWVSDLGEPFRTTAVVGAKAGGDSAVLTVWDWNRTPIAQVKLTAPGEEALSFIVTGRGTYLLTLPISSPVPSRSGACRAASASAPPISSAARPSAATSSFWALAATPIARIGETIMAPGIRRSSPSSSPASWKPTSSRGWGCRSCASGRWATGTMRRNR